MVQEQMAKEVGENHRQNGVRVHTGNPILVIGSKRVQAIDFNTSGFKAELPGQFRQVGSKGKAILEFDTTEIHHTHEIEFEVVRVDGAVCAASHKATSLGMNFKDGKAPILVKR